MVTPRRRLAPDDLHTVDEVADRLQVHRKTVLRFIRDGRLAATKIGKGYRIRRVDLDAFAGIPEDTRPVTEAARVTSVVDVTDVGPAWASKVAAAVTNALHGGPDHHDDVHAEVVYDPDRAQLKIIVVGTVADTRSLLGLIEIWLDQLTP